MLNAACCRGSASRPGDIKPLVSIAARTSKAALSLAKQQDQYNSGGAPPPLPPNQQPRRSSVEAPTTLSLPKPGPSGEIETHDSSSRASSQATEMALLQLDMDRRQYGGPALWVMDETLGKPVKMQAPHPLLISYHSSLLGEALGSSTARSNHEPGQSTLSTFSFLLPRDDGSLELRGSYGVWQEVFSHMGLAAPSSKGGSQIPLLRKMLANLPLPRLLDAFCLARYFRMFALLKRYRAVLVKKLSLTTFVPTFERALGRGLPRIPNALTRTSDAGAPTDPGAAGGGGGARGDFASKLDLALTQRCLAFMDEHMESLCDRAEPIRAQDVVALFHTALGELFF